MTKLELAHAWLSARANPSPVYVERGGKITLAGWVWRWKRDGKRTVWYVSDGERVRRFCTY